MDSVAISIIFPKQVTTRVLPQQPLQHQYHTAHDDLTDLKSSALETGIGFLPYKYQFPGCQYQTAKLLDGAPPKFTKYAPTFSQPAFLFNKRKCWPGLVLARGLTLLEGCLEAKCQAAFLLLAPCSPHRYLSAINRSPWRSIHIMILLSVHVTYPTTHAMAIKGS